jgi:hypothetical protein
VGKVLRRIFLDQIKRNYWEEGYNYITRSAIYFNKKTSLICGQPSAMTDEFLNLKTEMS